MTRFKSKLPVRLLDAEHLSAEMQHALSVISQIEDDEDVNSGSNKQALSRDIHRTLFLLRSNLRRQNRLLTEIEAELNDLHVNKNLSRINSQ